MKLSFLIPAFALASPVERAPRNAILEYLSDDILEATGNAGRDNSKFRIIPRHLQHSDGNNEDFNTLLEQAPNK